MGFRASADIASLQDAMQRALGDLKNVSIDAVVTEAAKARSPLFRDFVQQLGKPGIGVTASDLEQMITPTQSARIRDKFGTGSLAEAAALAAAGPDAQLIAMRVVSEDGKATAAIAENTGINQS